VLTNIKKRTVFGVLAQRTKKVVMAHLKTLADRSKVEVVTMDMWGPYRDAVKDTIPKAVIIVDKFHVVRLANFCLEQVRKGFRAGLEPKVRRRLMHDRFVLLRRQKDLKDEDKTKLEEWTKAFPELAEAHRLKEAFFAVYDSKTKQEAITAFEQWERSAGRDMLTAYKVLLTAMYNWKDHIFSYFDHRATNALTEALNGIAKNIEREGRGYSFEAIRAKMLFSKSFLKPARRPKFGTEEAGRGTPAEVYGTTWGADIDALLSVETAAGQHEQSHFLPVEPRTD
jgi:transposase